VLATDAVLSRAWRLNPQVSVRPERFGALAYHFGTRRLSFLKSRELLEVVTTLADHPTALDACQAAGIEEGQMPAYEQALAALAITHMIVPVPVPGSSAPE
jgi:putative mycofactocin binding protein MftB